MTRTLEAYPQQNMDVYNRKVKIALGIATGMCFLHESGYIHSDLKPDNIFVTIVSGGTSLLQYAALLCCPATRQGTPCFAHATCRFPGPVGPHF